MNTLQILIIAIASMCIVSTISDAVARVRTARYLSKAGINLKLEGETINAAAPDVTIKIDGEEVARATMKANQRMQNRNGGGDNGQG